MPMKRLLAVAGAISAVLIFGALAAGAVNGIVNDPHKAGEYSPIDPSRSGPNSEQGGADPSSTIDGATGASSAPDIATPSGVAITTGSNPASSSGSGAKPIVRGPSASSTGGVVPENSSPGSGAPATTTTSLDDHGGDNGGGHGSDDPLDDD
ncbi:hypothetical protein IMCC26256_11966 [Actinobacteria bacterium IMCC26256]|nr:hypothetical protein IMCC26256_11966 [Actinobacteria bacterium IMCC26256]